MSLSRNLIELIEEPFIETEATKLQNGLSNWIKSNSKRLRGSTLAFRYNHRNVALEIVKVSDAKSQISSQSSDYANHVYTIAPLHSVKLPSSKLPQNVNIQIVYSEYRKSCEEYHSDQNNLYSAKVSAPFCID